MTLVGLGHRVSHFAGEQNRDAVHIYGRDTPGVLTPPSLYARWRS